MTTRVTGDMTFTLGPEGQVVIPAPVLAHYGVTPETQFRLVETTNGILLVPQGPEPMDPALAAELAEWQDLFAEVIETFEYDEQAQPDAEQL